MLLHRDPFPFDFDVVASAAAKKNVYLEINASPERLDLTASLGAGGEGLRGEVCGILDGLASSGSIWRTCGMG